MPNQKKVSDQVLVAAYQKTGSVHRAAVLVGMNHASVHERLCKLGLMESMNLFSEEDENRLRRDYLAYRDTGRLNELAKQMKRTKHFLCRKARLLGLTTYFHPKIIAGSWKYMERDAAKVILEDFRGTPLNLKRYCKQRGYSEVAFWKTMTKFFPSQWEDAMEEKATAIPTCHVGRGFETCTRNMLRKRGYFAMLSPGSRSPIDVVAIKYGAIIFVQCKTSGVLCPVEWNALYDLAMSVGAIPVLAHQQFSPRTDFMRMLRRKDGGRKRQPWQPFDP